MKGDIQGKKASVDEQVTSEDNWIPMPQKTTGKEYEVCLASVPLKSEEAGLFVFHLHFSTD